MAKVLIIDDDPNMHKLYSDPLIKAGYEIDIAVNGQEGLSKMFQGGYDFILLDIMLPDIDGINILKRAKDKIQENFCGPIIVLSQLEEPQIIDSAIQNGARGYLVKASFTPDQLLAKVSEILQKTPPAV